MSDYSIQLPSKPKVVHEKDFAGVYQIDGLYPGYGHTLGNSLRRIILSSLPGAAITSVKIDGVSHEFSTLDGVKEDVISILLNLKKVRIRLATDEPVMLSLSAKGEMEVTAGDIDVPGQAEILNPEQVIAHLTDKKASLTMEINVEKGLGYMPKEALQKDKVDIGTVALDATFTPIRRVNYEVENMRVGDRTDFNRLKIFIETDGTIEPKVVLERSVALMIEQLRSIVGFEEDLGDIESELAGPMSEEGEAEIHGEVGETQKEFLKMRIEELGLSTRTENALSSANIRTVGGLVRKKEEDLLSLEGLGSKGIQEIKRALGNHGIILK